ncbi:hypothetical protein HELRODRAFT_182640 [Helobdella robusta]|uniref:Uncharacterized protein n=1 Tax=Helobdella robusta TaxID=6412 RepID=T1FIJ0_HELRO|nr:hypothetical protein HELRODRAFT_182640 [Helobdella robusta]ESN90807.1 hypothetical protein HELRODRAFT_182640 [Helobdella robusta]
MVRIGLLNAKSIYNKVDDVNGMIYAGLDILVLCETWHGTEGNISVRLAMPPAFTFVDFVRPHDPGHEDLILQFFDDKIARITETTNAHSEFPLQVVSMLDIQSHLQLKTVGNLQTKNRYTRFLYKFFNDLKHLRCQPRVELVFILMSIIQGQENIGTMRHM